MNTITPIINEIGEQQLPVAGGMQTHLLAIERVNRVLDRQNAKGFNKYGRYLNMFNGRNIIRDIEEEAADLNNYLEVLFQEYLWMRRQLLLIGCTFQSVNRYWAENLSQAEIDFIYQFKEEEG